MDREVEREGGVRDVMEWGCWVGEKGLGHMRAKSFRLLGSGRELLVRRRGRRESETGRGKTSKEQKGPPSSERACRAGGRAVDGVQSQKALDGPGRGR